MKDLRILLFFIIFLTAKIFVYTETKSQIFIPDLSPTYIENPFCIVGINEKSHFISYIVGEISSGNGDIRYSYVIYNYEANEIVEKQKWLWIARYFNDVGIDDWEDQKYSIASYKEIIKEIIIQSYQKYNLKDFKEEKKIVQNVQIYLRERDHISRWTENIIYELKFVFSKKEYTYLETLLETDIVKNISELSCYNVGDYLLFIQKIARDYFEDDDYYDYILRGIQK